MSSEASTVKTNSVAKIKKEIMFSSKTIENSAAYIGNPKCSIVYTKKVKTRKKLKKSKSKLGSSSKLMLSSKNHTLELPKFNMTQSNARAHHKKLSNAKMTFPSDSSKLICIKRSSNDSADSDSRANSNISPLKNVMTNYDAKSELIEDF